MASTDGIPAVDLFAGIGGLSIGAQEVGCDIRLAVEIDQRCCETLRLNPATHRGKVAQRDVATLGGDEVRALAGVSADDPFVVLGGAPCQPFSKAAYWTDPGNDAKYRRARSRGELGKRPEPITEPKPDERRSLIEEFWRIVFESNADAFVFENVPSILHPRNRPTFEDFRKAFDSVGYQTRLVRANAANFGVAQTRERVFLLGSKDFTPGPPVPTHRHGQVKHEGLPEPVSAGEVLTPFAGSEWYEHGEEISGKWAAELHEIPPGRNYKALTAWAGHPRPRFEPETRFWNFLLKLSPNRPSWTLAASPGPWTGPFHWDTRRLRTPEMACLQSFPSGMNLAGSRRERVRQIGNAVPPRLAAAVVAPLVDEINGAGHCRENSLAEPVLV